MTKPNGEDFGNAAAGVGDVNGDGYADVMVSAATLESVFLYDGSAAGLASSPAVTLTGPSGSLQFRRRAGPLRGRSKPIDDELTGGRQPVGQRSTTHPIPFPISDGKRAGDSCRGTDFHRVHRALTTDRLAALAAVPADSGHHGDGAP